MEDNDRYCSNHVSILKPCLIKEIINVDKEMGDGVIVHAWGVGESCHQPGNIQPPQKNKLFGNPLHWHFLFLPFIPFQPPLTKWLFEAYDWLLHWQQHNPLSLHNVRSNVKWALWQLSNSNNIACMPATAISRASKFLFVTTASLVNANILLPIEDSRKKKLTSRVIANYVPPEQSPSITDFGRWRLTKWRNLKNGVQNMLRYHRVFL